MDSGRLIGSEIHGFHTLQDLDVPNIMKEATTRWLRPNEIHAILCNHHCFTIKVKPINLPQSGAIILFDRKMLRNFRKDGHNWKKKKDGKTVKEAHEHLKVGNEERIHVYYAHGQDSPTFVRRCYWLLDKSLENIVLVHYRETQELQGSTATPLDSNSSTASDPSTHWVLPEEHDTGAGDAYHSGSGDNLSIRNYEQRIHEINTLDWDELVASDPSELTTTIEDKVATFDHHIQASMSGSKINGSPFSTDSNSALISSFGNASEALCQSSNVDMNYTNNVCIQKMGNPVNSEVQSVESTAASLVDSFDTLASDGLHSQDSFGRWMNSIIADSPSPVDNTILESSISSGQASFSSTLVDDQQAFSPEIIFEVTAISPAWAFSTEGTKILITGYFHEEYLHLAKSDLFCVCGDACIRTEIVQVGVYRCLVSPHAPGMVNLFLSTDGNRPISQVLNFEYRAPLSQDPVIPLPDYKSLNEAFQGQMRLANLLFSTSKCIDIASNKVSPTTLKEAKKFAHKASLDVSNNWSYIMNSFVDNKATHPQAKDVLFELTLKNKLIEWLLERIIEGYKTTEHDAQGQGVIHLCAILGYTWAVRLFSWSGLSLDFRDKHGWTALHWAAYCGKEKMVAALLSAGAKTYLVTDPTPENPGGCTAGDLASKQGYDGLGAYLAENSLVDHLKQIVISGNASESLQLTTETEKEQPEDLPEDELCLKDTLAAYRTAAGAAARIQTAFREHSFKLRTKVVESYSPEIEARNIIAAMKIQHAFRDYGSRKKMAAAARIQHRFRTWKMRQEFLAMRRHAIRIQAVFRGFQVRRQYRKIIWSVGVLEKAILRWRLRRKGFRGLKVDPLKEDTPEKQQSDAEDDFFRASRKQAEERVERSVVRVQAMFRSKKAQEEYRKIKLAHAQAKLEYGEVLNPNEDMDI